MITVTVSVTVTVRFRFSGLMSNKLCYDVSDRHGGARQSTVSKLASTGIIWKHFPSIWRAQRIAIANDRWDRKCSIPVIDSDRGQSYRKKNSAIERSKCISCYRRNV